MCKSMYSNDNQQGCVQTIMEAENTAIILIGFQNDYFAKDGALRSLLEPEVAAARVLQNTVALVDAVKDLPAPIISTPISFSSDYRELIEPVGILEAIRDVGAFQADTSGVDIVEELAAYGERIVEIPGKRGFNAFSDTGLDEFLRDRQIENLVIAGVISSVCVDSTARAAVELGYRVLVASDCTWGRTEFEQDYYCGNVFPLYAKLIDSPALAHALRGSRAVELPRADQRAIESLVNQRLFEELAAAEVRYRELVENLRNIVFGYDASSLLSFVNPAWSEVLGFEVSDPIGRSMEEYLIDEDKHRWREITHNCAEAGAGAHAQCELRINTARGETRWFDLSICASREGGVGFLYDITNTKEQHQRLQDTVVKTQFATEEKTRFLATMSHEIRTPMNGVIGMTDMLLRTELDDKQRSYVETLRSSGDAMLAQIDDILDMSKIEAGKLMITKQPEMIRDIIHDVYLLFQARAEQKKIQLVHHVSENVPTILRCDANRLKQILNNLLSNAIKFTHSGKVELNASWRASASGGDLTITVADTGVGVPSLQRHLLFEPFSQVDGSRSRGHGGTGLGLAICARLVKLMGGTIDCDSIEGQGSVFTITVPLSEPQSERTRESVHDSDAWDIGIASNNPLRILVAEDDDTNRMIICEMLNRLGYRPDIAHNGWEVLSLCQRNDYDLILMDIHMPKMDGIEATQRLLEAPRPQMPDIIALSADVLPENRERCQSLGMAGFISKPVTLGQLKVALRGIARKTPGAHVA